MIPVSDLKVSAWTIGNGRWSENFVGLLTREESRIQGGTGALGVAR